MRGGGGRRRLRWLEQHSQTRPLGSAQAPSWQACASPGRAWLLLGGPGRPWAARGGSWAALGRPWAASGRDREREGGRAHGAPPLPRVLEPPLQPSKATGAHACAPRYPPCPPPAIYHPRVDAHVSAHELQPLRHQEPDPVAAGRRARRGHAHRSHRPVARCRGQGDLMTAGLARRRPRRVERRAAHRQGDRSRRVTGEEGGARGAREPPRSLSRVPRSSGSLGHRSLVCSFVFTNLRG